MTKIKICGLCRDCDIAYVNAARPDYIGFVLHFPKSHRNVTSETAARLRRQLSAGIRAVGVFVDQPVETVAADVQKVGLDAVQLHGQEDDAYIAALRRRTATPIWQAFRVRTQDDLDKAKRSPADAVLLDSGQGSGEVFDWTLLQSFDKPFILAGGLTPETIPEAIRLLSPQMIDVSSGVETNKQKDPEKIQAAVFAAHNIYKEMRSEP